MSTGGQSYAQYQSPAGPSAAPTNNNTGGGGSQQTAAPAPAGFNRFDKNQDPGEGWGWHGPDGGWKQDSGGGSGAQDLSQQISDIYAPALESANEQERLARSGMEADQQNLMDRVAKSLADYGTQGEQLIQGTEGEQTKFNSVIESALNQAVRAYNALAQRAM